MFREKDVYFAGFVYVRGSVVSVKRVGGYWWSTLVALNKNDKDIWKLLVNTHEPLWLVWCSKSFQDDRRFGVSLFKLAMSQARLSLCCRDWYS